MKLTYLVPLALSAVVIAVVVLVVIRAAEALAHIAQVI
jgi:hypothetical protein